MVWGEIAFNMLKTLGCLQSPSWTAQYYFGCLAASAVWQRQLSHLLHSIFISLSTSGEAHRDLHCSHRVLFAQQGKPKPRHEGSPDQISFMPWPRWLQSPPHIASLGRGADKGENTNTKKVIRCL